MGVKRHLLNAGHHVAALQRSPVHTNGLGQRTWVVTSSMCHSCKASVGVVCCMTAACSKGSAEQAAASAASSRIGRLPLAMASENNMPNLEQHWQKE